MARLLKRRRGWAALLLVGLLLLFWGRILATMAASAPTMDEEVHSLHGVAYWRVPPSRMTPNITNNPPTVNAVMGVVINLVVRPSLDLPEEQWATEDAPYLGQQFTWVHNDNGLQIIFGGRMAVLCLAMLLAALVFRWAGQLYGVPAGLLSLAVFTIAPNILAHAGLASADLGTVFFIALAGYLVWRYWSHAPKKGLYVATGVALGAALGAKFSALYLLPAVIIIGGYRQWRTPRHERRWRRTAIEVAGWLLLATVAFLAIYRFDVGMLLEDFIWQQEHQLGGHPAYLLGELSTSGWWYYFPIVYAVKTPLPLIFLFVSALALFVWKRKFGWQQLWLLLLIAGVAGASLLTRVNIGYRYLLPLIPPMAIFIGSLAQSERRFVKGLTGLALLLLALESILIHPHYLSYFNLLAGGPDEGWRVAVDSNIEWGQDVSAVPAYLEEHDIDRVKVRWLSLVPFELYDIPAEPLFELFVDPDYLDLNSSFYAPRPAPGVYIIGVTHRQGLFEPGPELTRWFRERPPDDKINYSLFVYDVAPDGPANGLALSGIGLPHLQLADYEAAFAGNNVRPAWFDARSSLLWAGGENSRAWAAIGDGHLPSIPALQALYPAEGPAIRGSGLNADGETLNYGLYHWPESPIQPDIAVAGPVSFDGVVSLLGHSDLSVDQLAPGDSIDFLSFWRIEQEPGRDLLAFVHLVDDAGNLIAQHDGLAVRTEGLAPGDEMAQWHSMTLPSEIAPGVYELRVGLYDPQTGVRLRTPSGDYHVLDRLRLPAELLGSPTGS